MTETSRNLEQLPDIEGLDHSISPLKNKPKTYWRILIKFSDKQKTFEQRFRVALSEQDQEVCIREAHNLKGVSANLGMVDLQASCLNLEQACKQGLQGIDAPLEEVLNALQEMITRIDKS